MRLPPIERLRNGKMRFYGDYTFLDSIKGYSVRFDRDNFRCDLYEDGTLVIYAGSVYDMGSFAVDTPSMIIASAEHDAFCNMTNWRVLPWKVRKQADARFRKRLEEAGGTEWRWFRWVGVSLYSQLIARWKDKR